MKASKGGSMKVMCDCSMNVEIASKLFFEGGQSCKNCGKKYQTVPTNKPHTHKSSRERHGGHVSVPKATKKDKQDKKGK